MTPDKRRGDPSPDESPRKSSGHHTAAQGSEYPPKGLERAIANSDSWWNSCALMAIGWLADCGRTFDAYELTELGVPDPDDPCRWGSVFRIAHQAGAIEMVGYAPSRRPTAAGSIARVWRGVVHD